MSAMVVLSRAWHDAAYRLPCQQRATRMGHEEFCDSMCRRVAGLRVNPPLEPPRRLRRQLVPSRGASDRHGIEVCCLDDHVAGTRRELGRGSAHHTGETDGSGAVGDQESSGCNGRTTSSKVVSFSPSAALRTMMEPSSRSAS